MKHFLTFILVIAVLAGLFFTLHFDKSSLITKARSIPSPSPIPQISIFPSITITPIKDKIPNPTKEITQSYATKYGRKVADVSLTVTDFDSHFAKGTVYIKMYPESKGWFLAAKVEDDWKIVQDGNGKILCSKIKTYNFPVTMVAECFK